tara:strand:+ start:49 stop:192 length:144 start_codon:yes stop_codon:yes gene_type:complete
MEQCILINAEGVDIKTATSGHWREVVAFATVEAEGVSIPSATRQPLV